MHAFLSRSPGTCGVPRRGISLRVSRRLRAATSRYLTRSSRGFILRSYARESENPRVYYIASTLSRTLRSSARPRSINKPCSYSFLTQGKIACEESVLQLGLVQKGAHISLVYSVHRPIYRLYFPPYIRKFTSWLAEKE